MNRISICLSDIPREKLKKATNGKIYVNLIVAERHKPDQFSNDLTVYVDQTKEERSSQIRTDLHRSRPELHFSQSPVNPEAVNELPEVTNTDDLPYLSPGTKID
jgi:hypothetical protein